ncbi:hypothetical protein BGZ60DRAFT_367404 [Tricladium varicosporioides]|nr:hypothetical protein BGZ60DRAFT_367404 [Hymenoscyphus varicosporioides]
MADIDESALSVPRYRPAKTITEELRKHCHIYLDEQIYESALTLLNDLVTTGASNPHNENTPAIAPSPYHIELVSCLLIHPRYTTQAPPDERLDLGARSISLLRNILAILGPVNANLDEAFSLDPIITTRNLRRGRNTAEHDDSSGNESEDRPERMQGVIANKGRIRKCAKDFWHIVGWAFNCSIQHPKRWQHWKVWLAYMLDVLDADYTERKEQDEEKHMDPKKECPYAKLRESILVKYLSMVQGRSSPLKRVVRSVFADGSPDSLKEFPEVFENETKEVKHSGQKRKRANTGEFKFGDYDDEINYDFESPGQSSPMQGDDDEKEEKALEQDPYIGGPETITLRQRLLMLLSKISADLPDEFVDVRDLYDAFYSSIKSISVPAFSLFLSSSASSQLPVIVLVSLGQLLLLRLLPNTAPRPHRVSGRDSDELSQEIFERCFFPFSANTSSVADNARVSILVENLFRLYLRECKRCHASNLREAIETGIVARESKIKGDKRRKDTNRRTKQDESDLLWLRASGERLRLLVNWVEQHLAEDDDDDDDN